MRWLTLDEESTRLKFVEFYSNKVNQHVYWIVTLVVGGLTYLSGITNIILFLMDKMNHNTVSGFLISCTPLLFISFFLFYTIGRTFYWDILYTISSNLLYGAHEASDESSILEMNPLEFQSRTITKFDDLREGKYSARIRYKIAYFVTKGSVKILVYFSFWYLGFAIGLLWRARNL